jgi:hypothetical protein
MFQLLSDITVWVSGADDKSEEGVSHLLVVFPNKTFLVSSDKVSAFA